MFASRFPRAVAFVGSAGVLTLNVADPRVSAVVGASGALGTPTVVTSNGSEKVVSPADVTAVKTMKYSVSGSSVVNVTGSPGTTPDCNKVDDPES